MSLEGFMGKIRQWDNQVAKWMMGHFYILFFQIFLVFIFLLSFINIIKSIDLCIVAERSGLSERLLAVQTSNSNILVVLLLLNSFWLLFIFSGLVRIRSLLKDINFTLMRNKYPKDSS